LVAKLDSGAATYLKEEMEKRCKFERFSNMVAKTEQSLLFLSVQSLPSPVPPSPLRI
jgi:hypothetical protein